MRRMLFILLFFPCLLACYENLEEPIAETVGIRELIFGRFYGRCAGESCVEIYLVNEKELLEDTTDNPLFEDLFHNGQYISLGIDDHIAAVGLLEEVPAQLVEGSNHVYGCPDCADQGGLYLKIVEGDKERNYLFDLSLRENPEYLRPYLNKVNNVVDELTR